MPHLEGNLALVSAFGPWGLIRGRDRVRWAERPVYARLTLSHESGLVLDVVVRKGGQLVLGWYPSHRLCKWLPAKGSALPKMRHSCWAVLLSEGTHQLLPLPRPRAS